MSTLLTGYTNHREPAAVWGFSFQLQAIEARYQQERAALALWELATDLTDRP
jgi:hypothetical protein